MAITAADLEALDRAIVRGELEVEYDGQRVRYRSIAELKEARAHAATVLASGGGALPLPGRTVFQFAPTTRRGY